MKHKTVSKSSSARVPKKHDLGFLMAELANMADSDVRHFRSMYDNPPVNYRRYSDEDLLRIRDELRLVWEYDADRRVEYEGLSGRQFSELAHAGKIKQIVDNRPEEPLQKVVCDYWLRSEKQPFEVIWRKQEKKFRPRPQSLPSILAWGCVYYAGHLKFCANPGCDYPYFIAKRKDQKYCRSECAAPAKREAKRKWWTVHRGKSVQQQQRKAATNQ